MKAAWAEDGALYVFGREGTDFIPYPSAYVFEFEDKLFADLVAAYRRADDSALTALWSRARPLVRQSLN